MTGIHAGRYASRKAAEHYAHQLKLSGSITFPIVVESAEVFNVMLLPNQTVDEAIAGYRNQIARLNRDIRVIEQRIIELERYKLQCAGQTCLDENEEEAR